ncbi:MAG: 2-amino-4-hydroxy-6-hydroxymethyldihydropteridine pyrophosphokinase [Ignavibacteriales bacterium]
MEVKVFLGIGSNIEPRAGYILRAIQLLSTYKDISINRLSSIYRARPLGSSTKGEFLNLVAEITTDVSPEELFQIIKNTEVDTGRIMRKRWGAREIDIDIIFYGDLVYHSELLDIPHRGLMERDFFVYPLLELEPKAVNPETGERLSSISFETDEMFIAGKYDPKEEPNEDLYGK